MHLLPYPPSATAFLVAPIIYQNLTVVRQAGSDNTVKAARVLNHSFPSAARGNKGHSSCISAAQNGNLPSVREANMTIG